MFRYLFGIEVYAIVQVAALLLFGALAVFLFRRSGLRLRHAAALTALYFLCNFLVAKLLFDYVKAGGRHTLLDHPALEHFLEGGFWGWPIAFLPCALAYPLALGVPVGTVKSRLYRTTQQMRATLDADARVGFSERRAT